MPATELNAIVTQRIEITPSLIKLRVVADGWEFPDFSPGQFVALGLPGNAPRHNPEAVEEKPPKDPEKLIRRAYSVASSSVAKEYLEFYVALVGTGSLSPRLLGLKEGDRLFIGPKFKGMFTLGEVPEIFNVALIATGTGVAPYMSMIRTELASGLSRRFAVIHGAYHVADLGYHSELNTLASVSPQFSYFPVLSHPHEDKTEWKGAQGFVQKIWTEGSLEKEWGVKPSPDNTHVFLCGNPLMIEGMTELLEKEGFQEHSRKIPDGQIHSEKF